MAKTQRMIALGAGFGLLLTQREMSVVLAIMEGHTCAGAVNMAQLVLMMTGVLPCPAALLPVQRIWRRKHYKLEEN